MPFVKLDTGILDSSLWSEPAQTCKCWITLLAMADSSGFVRATAPGIARRANLATTDTEKALSVFESPDKHSRSLNDQGKRIVRMEQGYQIVNYGKYREKDHTAAERMRRYRSKVTRNVTSRYGELHKQKQSTEAEEKKRESLSIKRMAENVEVVIQYAKHLGVCDTDARYFFDTQEAGGWKRNGKPLNDWRAALRAWYRGGFLPSQRTKGNGSRQLKTGRNPDELMSDKLWQLKHGSS